MTKIDLRTIAVGTATVRSPKYNKSQYGLICRYIIISFRIVARLIFFFFYLTFECVHY